MQERIALEEGGGEAKAREKVCARKIERASERGHIGKTKALKQILHSAHILCEVIEIVPRLFLSCSLSIWCILPVS